MKELLWTLRQGKSEVGGHFRTQLNLSWGWVGYWHYQDDQGCRALCLIPTEKSHIFFQAVWAFPLLLDAYPPQLAYLKLALCTGRQPAPLLTKSILHSIHSLLLSLFLYLKKKLGTKYVQMHSVCIQAFLLVKPMTSPNLWIHFHIDIELKNRQEKNKDSSFHKWAHLVMAQTCPCHFNESWRQFM